MMALGITTQLATGTQTYPGPWTVQSGFGTADAGSASTGAQYIRTMQYTLKSEGTGSTGVYAISSDQAQTLSTQALVNWKTHFECQLSKCWTTNVSTPYYTIYTIDGNYCTVHKTGYHIWGENGFWIGPAPKSPADRLREIIRSRSAPAFLRQRDPRLVEDNREKRARETLRVMLGEEKYRRYLTRGFVAIRARSGLTYRIFAGHKMTEVYRVGVLTERLCVVLRGNFPPTDELIMRYLLILNDEADFRSRANISPPTKQPATTLTAPIDNRPLSEIFRELRGRQVAASRRV